MREYKYKIDTESVLIRTADAAEDLSTFEAWLNIAKAQGPIGVDSEATGLMTYGKDRLRMVQFGTATEAWVIPVENLPHFSEFVKSALLGLPAMVLHNASFDLQVFQRHLGVSMEKLWPHVIDTRILAHLVDPRGQEEGGTGHSLEALVKKYVDPIVAEEVKGLMTRIAREHKTTKALIWDKIDIEHPDFNLYAGMDPILAVRLLGALAPLVPHESWGLIKYEHEIAKVCSYMERTGFLLDTEYTASLSKKLKVNEDEAAWHAAAFFEVDSVNSTAQVADALEELGFRITGKTPTGKRKVDALLLDSLLVDNPVIGSQEHLAAAVSEAKKARKWRTTWVDGFLRGVDGEDRVHASINPLRARTARMAISGIPAQTLPSGDWMIRRCFIADPGHVMASIDYDSQEMRVLAALSQDEAMIEVFQGDGQIHLATARSIFGSHVTKGSSEYKTGKMAGFLKVFGGGKAKLALQAGIEEGLAGKVLSGFNSAYPGVAQYTKEVQRQAEEDGHVITPFGRVLPVDEDRPYSALNYVVQSSARDITCQGLVRMHNAGLTSYMRLPIHDEVLVSLPEKDANWMAEDIARLMRQDFRGVDISASGEVGQRSWGSLYGADY